MRIFVREPSTGTTRIIEGVEGSDTIDHVKAKIQVPKKLQKIVIFIIYFQDTRDPPSKHPRERLCFAGRTLEEGNNNKTMSDYNIVHESTFDVIIDRGGGHCPKCGRH